MRGRRRRSAALARSRSRSNERLPPPGFGRDLRYTVPVAKTSARTLVLRPADPFDLIRWLARSQSDPRKAVAELVQNSIDAHARHWVVSRRRVRGGPALTVRGDGEGGLPSLGRVEGLRYRAPNVSN